MKRKQLYAVIMAGTLAASGAPVSAMAADTAAEAEEGSEAGDFASGGDTETSQEENQEEESAQDPAETPADSEEETPTDEAEASTDPTEAPADPTETPADAVETSEEPTGIAINKTDGTTTYYKTLQEAVDAVEAYSEENQNATVIEVSSPIVLSSTVTISDKMVCIRAAQDVSVTRESDTFTGDMFHVSGKNGELQLEAADGAKLTVSGAFTSDQTSADGSIVNVADQGRFGLGAGVTLTQNISSMDGAAINCTGGNIVLNGGTITGNTGVKGAVYSDSNILVQGTVKVKDNKINDAQANVYLDGTAQFAVTAALTDSEISFTHGQAADGMQVLAAAEDVDAETFSSAAAQFSYDTEDYSLNTDATNKIATLKKAETPETTPFLTYTKGSLAWKNHTTVSLEMSTTRDCNWYYFYVDSGTSNADIQKQYNPSLAVNSVKANNKFTVTANEVPEKDSWLAVCVKPDSGKAQIKVFKLDSAGFKKKRPAAPSSSFLSYKNKTIAWTNHTTVSLKMSTTEKCKWYYTYVNPGTSDAAIKKNYKASLAKNTASGGEFTVTAKNVPTADKWLVIYAESTASGKLQTRTFKLDQDWFKKNRPATTSSFLSYKSGTIAWTSPTTISLKMSTTKACNWYCTYVKPGTSDVAIKKMWDSSRATKTASGEFTVVADNVPTSDSWLVVFAKPTTSGDVAIRTFKLNSEWFKKKRPSLTPTTPTRAARKHDVSESTVTGLENALKFKPGVFYEFTVTGAGQNDEAPYVSDDERWIPMYWKIVNSEGQEGATKNTNWRIGSSKGIADASSYKIRIYLKKQVYNGSEWQDTGVEQSIDAGFKSQELTPEDLTVTPSGGADGGSDGSGENVTEAELTATEAATEKANGSTSKSAVSTMDESPIGTMMALAAFSLLAGGYILIRRRKKDI